MELLDKNLRLKKPIILNNVEIGQSLGLSRRNFYSNVVLKIKSEANFE